MFALLTRMCARQASDHMGSLSFLYPISEATQV